MAPGRESTDVDIPDSLRAAATRPSTAGAHRTRALRASLPRVGAGTHELMRAPKPPHVQHQMWHLQLMAASVTLANYKFVLP